MSCFVCHFVSFNWIIVHEYSKLQVVVGDQRGVLQLISIRKGEPFVDFKVELRSPVNCVNVVLNDKYTNGKYWLQFRNTNSFLFANDIFNWLPGYSCTHAEPTLEMIVATTTQAVQGFSVKGKVIFKMDTNLVEPIQHL